MPAALPIELRERIVAAYERGEGTYAQIAQRFRVGVASVNRYLKRSRRGELSPSAHGGGRVALIGPNDAQTLARLASSAPDTSAQDLTDKWKRQRGVQVSVSAMKRAMHRFGLTYKKSLPRHRTTARERSTRTQDVQRGRWTHTQG